MEERNLWEILRERKECTSNWQLASHEPYLSLLREEKTNSGEVPSE